MDVKSPNRSSNVIRLGLEVSFATATGLALETLRVGLTSSSSCMTGISGSSFLIDLALRFGAVLFVF